MSPEKATEVVRLIGELWPHPEMTARRAAFYATALSAVPEADTAMRVVYGLFVTERYQPVPADVIDACMGVRERAAEEWDELLSAATDVQHRRAVGTVLHPASVRLLRGLGYDLRSLPLADTRTLDRVRAKFVTAFSDLRRQEVAAVMSPNPRGAIAEAS